MITNLFSSKNGKKSTYEHLPQEISVFFHAPLSFFKEMTSLTCIGQYIINDIY